MVGLEKIFSGWRKWQRMHQMAIITTTIRSVPKTYRNRYSFSTGNLDLVASLYVRTCTYVCIYIGLLWSCCDSTFIQNLPYVTALLVRQLFLRIHHLLWSINISLSLSVSSLHLSWVNLPLCGHGQWISLLRSFYRTYDRYITIIFCICRYTVIYASSSVMVSPPPSNCKNVFNCRNPCYLLICLLFA